MFDILYGGNSDGTKVRDTFGNKWKSGGGGVSGSILPVGGSFQVGYTKLIK